MPGKWLLDLPEGSRIKRCPGFRPPIARTRTGASRGPHRSLPVAPLIGDQRCYGEALVGLRRCHRAAGDAVTLGIEYLQLCIPQPPTVREIHGWAGASTTRNPITSNAYEGSRENRKADRHCAPMLCQLPPRITFAEPDAGPGGSVTLPAG